MSLLPYPGTTTFRGVVLAAPQPLPLGRLCQLPPMGCGPQPTAPLARGPAGMAVAPGFRPGFGRWPRCRGRRRCHGLSWPWTTRPLRGGRSRPPQITACGARASRRAKGPRSCAKRRGWSSATWWRAHCCAEPPWGGVAPPYPWGAEYALAYWPARSSRLATR